MIILHLIRVTKNKKSLKKHKKKTKTNRQEDQSFKRQRYFDIDIDTVQFCTLALFCISSLEHFVFRLWNILYFFSGTFCISSLEHSLFFFGFTYLFSSKSCNDGYLALVRLFCAQQKPVIAFLYRSFIFQKTLLDWSWRINGA